MNRVRLSVRVRLTLVYGALFMVTAGALVAVTYWLTARAIDARFRVPAENSDALARRLAAGTLPLRLDQLALRQDAERQMAEQKREVLAQLLQSCLLTLLVVG
ncbi:MAG: hypothetical protein IRY90_15550, partial [Actinomadura rubrobrunea]|nr:hypothetical protein [Actinomadura rubrobrunea]